MTSPDTNGVASAATPASELGPGADPNADGSKTASAASSPSVRITSDIAGVSSENAAPVPLRNPTASPMPSPAVQGQGQGHGHGPVPVSGGPGVGIRTAGPSNSNTPRHSPALPSPSVNSPRPDPVAPRAQTQPQPMVMKLGRWQVKPTNFEASLPEVPIAGPRAPGTGRQTAVASPTGFPSPGREHMQSNPRVYEDRNRTSLSIQQAMPEAVRRSVRENWEKCLLGSEFHQAFVLNASIHHATPGAVRRGMRDFGKAMVTAAKHEIIDQMTPADLDQVVDQILAKASDSFLDIALAHRIKTIEAMPLINALARAERLGYESSDVVDEGNLHGPAAPQPSEYVMPSVGSPATPSAPISHPPVSGPLHCAVCFRKFNHQSSYEHHVRGKVCTRSPNSPGGFKFSCQHCGQGFTTVMGLKYHNANKVCGDFGEPIKVSRGTPSVPSSTTAASQVMSPAPTPVTPAVVKSTPKGPASAVSQKGTPRVSTPGDASQDPYAHLSPEQISAMQQELLEAEHKYSEKMQHAFMIAGETERKNRLDGLSNSFGTRQSMIRKKFGVRLRMRRTKGEIQSERDRIHYRTAAELIANLGSNDTPRGPGRPITSSIPRPHANPRGGSSWPTANNHASAKKAPTASTLASSLPVPKTGVEAHPETMDVTMHSKRRLSTTDTKSPNRKRVAYSQMGGLSSAAAAAETQDPTQGMAAPTLDFTKGNGTANEPMALDDSDNSDSEDSDDDEDIPAKLPISVRQSLQTSSPVALGGESSRPSSSSAK